MQRDKQGLPAAILETNNDITERKRAEEERRYNTQLLRTMTDNASSMLYMVDAAGLGTFVNRPWSGSPDIRPRNLSGKSCMTKSTILIQTGGPIR
jgi:PAS domain-containing protein